jgi:4-hydroxymandelate oxidase
MARAMPVYLARAAHRAYPDDCAWLRAPEHRAAVGTYLTDLLRPSGTPLRTDRLDAGAGQSYGEMAADLVAAVVPADEPVDLLVLAFALPDVQPGRATATYLSHVCPGRPIALGLCDQGVAAAFTGLRLVAEHLAQGAGRRGLLLVVEQATLHYDPVGPATMPAGNAAVALLCTTEPGSNEPHPTKPGATGAAPRVGPVRVRADVAAADVPARLAADLPDAATVIAGAGLAGHPWPAGPVVRPAPAGQPGTGVWAELAGAWGEPRAAGLVLADYEPQLGYLCTATVVSGL